MKPLLLMVPAAALGVLLMSGCQNGSSTNTGSGQAGAATTAAAGGSAGGATPAISETPTAKPGSAGAAPVCTISRLAVSIGGQQGGAGHSSGAIRFRNTGTSACRLYGYPGVAALDSAGKQIAQARRTPRGYMGGLGSSQHTPMAVTLAPGHTASALVEADNAAPNGNSCGTVPALLVTPPNETHHVKLSWQGGCSGFQIHPVVTGDSGQGITDHS